MATNAYGLRLLAKPAVQRLMVVLLALIVLVYRVVQFVKLTREIQWGYDFSAYWSAAARLLAGTSLYSAAQLAGPYGPQQQFLYLYPPPLSAAVMPLAQLFPADYRAAAWVWAAVGGVIVVAVALALWRSERLGERFPMLRGRGRWLLVAAAFAFPPVVGELVLGNAHLLLLGLLTLAWLGIRRGTAGGEWTAGLAVGVAAVIKVFPGLLLVWFLLTRRWKAAGGVVIGVAVAAIVALPFTGFQPWLDFPRVLLNLSAPTDTTDTLAPTVWLAPLLGFTAARIAVTVVGVAIVGWVALARPAPAIGFATTVVVSVLIAPALYQHYLALLVLPLILALGAGASRLWLAVAYFLMWGGQQDALGDAAFIVNRVAPTLGALVLLAALVLAARRSAGSVAELAPDPHLSVTAQTAG